MFFSGKLDEAIDHITEAIMLNPTSAILKASRGNLMISFFKISFIVFIFIIVLCSYVSFSWKPCILLSASIFVKLNKPNAAIRDANAAIEVG